jgi:hypothetical protein
MKRLILILLLAATAALAQSECSLETVRGTYLVSYSGWVTTPTATVYATILGVISIDPGKASHLSGGITFAGFAPTPMFVPAAGTVQVNADCTGVVRIGNPATGASEIDQFYYSQADRKLTLIVNKIAIGNISALGTWKQISPMPGAATWSAPPAK